MTVSAIPVTDAASAAALAALHGECFDEPWDAAAIARLLALPGAFGYCASASDGTDAPPDGFVLARSGGGEGEILTICVRPSARMAGLGRQLLEAAAAHAVSAGAGALFLEVAEDNLSALHLYERFGFYLVGMRPAYYGRGDDRVAARTLKLDLPSVINP